MTERMYRLLEALQRVDRLLDLARSRKLPDPFEIAGLERKRRMAGSRFRDGLVQS
ncbi:hypothetical protein ACFSTD_15960 [Novosphingobium colocasiae]|uniref:Uncharacterized protein n=1 Tax=Novosphingobium colocasiae TaxID=1256513 RepID=A0A918PA32_9SPHN|nr:DUF465 domain-containing protein [Novosphingobium colocasiae]GGY94618.1 hypothetical protein GCM10011614_07100 [Novosphingobium colocasiae]